MITMQVLGWENFGSHDFTLASPYDSSDNNNNNNNNNKVKFYQHGLTTQCPSFPVLLALDGAYSIDKMCSTTMTTRGSSAGPGSTNMASWLSLARALRVKRMELAGLPCHHSI